MTTKTAPQGLTLKVFDQEWAGRPTLKRGVQAFIDGRSVGHLLWFTTDADGHRAGEIVNVSVDEAYRRQGIAEAMLVKAREVDPLVHHSTALSPDGEAWSRAVGAKRPVASYASPNGGTIWRGMRLPVSDEVRTLAKSYWDESELGEHRTAKIGQIFLDLMSSHPGRHSGPGLGIHWSIRPEMAGVAAETSGQRLDWPVVIEATYTAADVVPEGDPLYDESGVWTRSGIEAEVLIRPGARLTVTGLWLAEDFAGSNIFAVDKCPKMNIRGTKYRNVLPSPQQRTAEVRPKATIARITNFTGDALGWNHESAGHLSLRDHAGAPQGGGRDARSAERAVRGDARGQVAGGDLRPRPQRDDYRRGDRGDRAGVRALASVAAPDYLIGPILRVWSKYAPQTQQQIVAAMRRLRDGRLTPDAKQRELRGYYTIPVGGIVSTTPDRLLLVHREGVWLAVYFVANHNYTAAEHVIEAWEESTGIAPRRTESSLTKVADEDQCPYCHGDGLMRGGRYRCQDCMRTFTSRVASAFGLTFTTKARSSGTARQVDAFLDGKPVGRIIIAMPESPHPSVEGIFVDPDHRRSGIGTALFREAQRYCSAPLQHSTHRTVDGDDFARSLDPTLEPSSMYEPDLWMDL